jgi:hypothetical protein
MLEYRELGRSIEALVTAMAEIADDHDKHRAIITSRSEALADQASSGLAETARILLGSAE